MASRTPIIPLSITALIVGVLGTCLVVTHLKAPINPNRLHASVHSQLKTSRLSRQHGPAVLPATVSGKEEVFLASRAAIRATNHAYNLRTVLDALLQPPRSADYSFHEEAYRRGSTGSLEFARSLRGEVMEGSLDPEGTGDNEPDVWNPYDEGQETTRTELEDILLVNLPVLLVFAALFCAVEIAAMLARRGRDWMLQSGLSKLSDATFRAQVARESQLSTFRPYLSSLFGLCVFSVIAASIDIFGKCYWNWPCWFDLDCNVRILAPAVLECTGEVFFPAFILTSLILMLLLAAIWCLARPWPAALLGTLVALGLVAIYGTNELAVLLWLLGAGGAVWFYFWALPARAPEEIPPWCQDLGSLSASSDPATRELRDGDAAQRWRTVEPPPAPTTDEMNRLNTMEMVAWRVSDFFARHCRELRTLWNGVVIRALVTLCVGRRVRISGAEHVAHLGSHDSVLLAANHRTFFDFFVITVLGLWNASGASFFSLYPVRATYFYSNPVGALINLFMSASAMFPPILNTPSDEARGDHHSGGREWNDYAVRRMVAELRAPGTVLGIHPEGTRNKDKDPCSMTKVKSGVGRLAIESPQAHVIPVFITGLGDNLWAEICKNFSESPLDNHPIDIVFGPHVDLSALRAAPVPPSADDGAGADAAAAAGCGGDRREVYASAGRAVTDAILALGAQYAAAAAARAETKVKERAGDDAGPYQQQPV